MNTCLFRIALFFLESFCCLAAIAQTEQQNYSLEVLPAQAKHRVDEVTGVSLLFLTDGTLASEALYFHERSFLCDNSVILFYAKSPFKGGMGYLTETGELVRLKSSDGVPLGQMTCGVNRPVIYAIAKNRVLEISLEITVSDDPATQPSQVLAREREICQLPSSIGSLNESCDGQYLAIGGTDPIEEGKTAVFIIDIQSGEVKRLCGMPKEATLGVSHLQWSITNPHLLSFANAPNRIWIVDRREGKPFAPYKQHSGELVTHEMWWKDDLLLFCGGTHPKPQEDGHVKTLNPHTGEVRIVGAGAWWSTATPLELAKYNFWHPCGSADGKWIVADNWHGDLTLFEGGTTRARLLTRGHRTYGEGTHPEPSWNPGGNQVIFSSHLLDGIVNTCVATVPADWADDQSGSPLIE
ncbi:MAG: hypothetical protein ACRC10_02570 [Thermoguttaceae bacterium]